MAVDLLAVTDTATLLSHAWSERPGAYGFAGTRSPAKTALLVGVHRTDLALALRVRHVAAARSSIDRILELLDHDTADAAAYRDLRGGVSSTDSKGLPPVAAGPHVASVEHGEWLETARLAAIARSDEPLKAAQLRDALRSLASASPAAARKVGAIERLIGALPGDDASWEQLQRALADLIRMP